MSGRPPRFALETFAGPAGEFHRRDLLADPRPRVVVCAATGPALVLGSRQGDAVVDPAASRREGVDVVRRRSGGGAVLVEPGALCWFDVVVPADDPRFAAVHADVTASMRWLGGHVVAALRSLGVGADVHPGPMTGSRWSELVCFAGLGPGEVLLDGRKLVGISQRRTRVGARFQCAVHTRWNPGLLRELLAPTRPDVGECGDVAVLAVDVADALPAAVARVLSGD